MKALSFGPNDGSSLGPGRSLETLEPYAVMVAVVVGMISAGGGPHGATPPLVALCWVLFLWVEAGGTTIGAPGLLSVRPWVPSLLCAVFAGAIMAEPWLFLAQGTRESLAAVSGAGLAYLLLPVRAHGSNARWSLSRSTDQGGSMSEGG